MKQPNTPQALFARMLEQVYPGFPWDDSAEETARRFVTYLEEYRPKETYPFKLTTFETSVNQMIVVPNIEFTSICMHHLLPFWGLAHVGYIPNKLMVGASKIPRVVDFWASRPQTQEYITAAIATDLKHKLEAMGVAVVLVARHTCMACRGVRKMRSKLVTSEMRGAFLNAEAARAEFFDAIKLAKED